MSIREKRVSSERSKEQRGVGDAKRKGMCMVASGDFDENDPRGTQNRRPPGALLMVPRELNDNG